MHQPEARRPGQIESREEEQLAEVLDDEIVATGRPLGAGATGQHRVVAEAAVAEAVIAHAARTLLGGAPREGGAEHRHLDAVLRDEARRRLLEMHLDATRERMAEVPLVEHEDAHRRRLPDRSFLAQSRPMARRAFSSQTIQSAS